MRKFLILGSVSALLLCVGIAVTQDRGGPDREKQRPREGRFGGPGGEQGRGPGGGPGGPPGGLDPERIIERIYQGDKNDDGKISKEEADHRLREDFANVDTNEDGFVTKDELRKRFEQGPPPGGPDGPGRGPGGQGGPGGGPGGGPEHLLEIMPVIQALDKDKDGEISEKEVENAVAALKTLDKNKDGVISRDEMMPDPSQFRGPGGPGGRGSGSPEARGGQPAEKDVTDRPKRPTFDDDVQ